MLTGTEISPVLHEGPLILIAEDEPDIRSALEDVLQEEGYEVISAVDGRAALELLKRSARLPELIVCNLMMPRLNGWELLGILRAKDSRFVNVPALVLSATEEVCNLPPGVLRARKPISLDALLLLVAKCIRTDASPNPELPGTVVDFASMH